MFILNFARHAQLFPKGGTDLCSFQHLWKMPVSSYDLEEISISFRMRKAGEFCLKIWMQVRFWGLWRDMQKKPDQIRCEQLKFNILGLKTCLFGVPDRRMPIFLSLQSQDAFGPVFTDSWTPQACASWRLWLDSPQLFFPLATSHVALSTFTRLS